jgi:hypothetical protein
VKPSKPLKEIIIVIGVFIVLWAISFLLIAPLFGNRALDINVHGTYNIVGSVWSNSVMPAFLWLLTIGYLIRAALYKFKDRTQNIILLISCTGLNILILTYLKETAQFSGINLVNNSSIGVHSKIVTPNYEDMMQTLFVLQVILIFLLSIIAAITAKNWNSNKDVY